MLIGMRPLLFLLLALPLVYAQGPNEANYDEAKVGTFTLPDPLVTASGKPVKDARTWRTERRPEIVRLFETYVYGKSAPAPTRIDYEVLNREEKVLGGGSTRKIVQIWLTPKRPGPSMQLLIYMPAQRSGPVPVFLGCNFPGNHAVSKDPGVPLRKVWGRDGTLAEPPETARGSSSSRWPIDMVNSKGYAVATFHYSEVFPDHKAGLKDSIIPHLYKPGQSAQAPDDWNAIGAWAWALSRAMDYIEKDKDLDAKRVAVLGHSRLGKTSLWAGAMDERFSIVISNDSGEGGAALSRRNFGETVRRINTSFPHWFNENYKQYNERVNDLPIDQHMLLSLIAPRPLYVASAQDDKWADPKGEFLSAKAADPVYRLLGKEGLPAKEWPGIHQPVHGTIGYHIRAGKHDINAYDWEQFTAFAAKHWKK
jgi:hypothetical protein